MSAEHLLVGYEKKKPVYEIDRFAICKGEIVGLMGSNGVGKSTFAKTLCGLQKPIAGTMEPVKEKERLKKSFMVMQDVNYQLFSDSVREEVLLGANRPELCEAVLEALGLTEFADRRQSLQTAPDTKENLDDRAGNGKAAGIKKDRSILAGA